MHGAQGGARGLPLITGSVTSRRATSGAGEVRAAEERAGAPGVRGTREGPGGGSLAQTLNPPPPPSEWPQR